MESHRFAQRGGGSRHQSPAVVSNNLPWSFLFAPVLAGAVLLAAFAYVWHRRICRRPWPRRWF
jgi:CBS-domain-containing membrane protein